jgi:hypothetical protein
MVNNKRNLWGNLSVSANIRTPFTILKEQASILTEMTNGLLVGEVKRFSIEEGFAANLRVRVPTLGGYAYSILRVNYPPDLYPLNIMNLTNQSPAKSCGSEEEFEVTLGKVLSSESVQRVISALLADVQADGVSEEETDDF